MREYEPGESYLKPKGDPPEMPRVGWFTRLCWRVWADWIIYPAQARALKKAGFRRTGWRKWE